MNELNLGLINGMMLGIEFPNVEEIDEDITFAMVIDFFIIRIMFLRWKNDA